MSFLLRNDPDWFQEALEAEASYDVSAGPAFFKFADMEIENCVDELQAAAASSGQTSILELRSVAVETLKVMRENTLKSRMSEL